MALELFLGAAFPASGSTGTLALYGVPFLLKEEDSGPGALDLQCLLPSFTSHFAPNEETQGRHCLGSPITPAGLFSHLLPGPGWPGLYAASRSAHLLPIACLESRPTCAAGGLTGLSALSSFLPPDWQLRDPPCLGQPRTSSPHGHPSHLSSLITSTKWASVFSRMFLKRKGSRAEWSGLTPPHLPFSCNIS